MALLSRQLGSDSVESLQFPSPKQRLTAVSPTYTENRGLRQLLNPDFSGCPTWPSVILVPGKGCQGLWKTDQNESMFPSAALAVPLSPMQHWHACGFPQLPSGKNILAFSTMAASPPG